MRVLLLTASLFVLMLGSARAQDSGPWMGPPLPQESSPWRVGRMLEDCRALIKHGERAADPIRSFDQGICGGFFSGLMFYASRLPEAIRFCPTDTATVREAVYLVITQVEKRPELMFNDMRTVAPLALQVDWPCK